MSGEESRRERNTCTKMGTTTCTMDQVPWVDPRGLCEQGKGHGSAEAGLDVTHNKIA